MIFFKRKKEKKEKKEKVKKEEKKQEQKEDKLFKKAPTSFLADKILIRPIVTEKSALLAEKNQYLFEVSKNSTKDQIKRAIKEVYNLDVKKVRVINIPKKPRKRFGRQVGWKKGYKKAIVTLKEGQKIEILPR